MNYGSLRMVYSLWVSGLRFMVYDLKLMVDGFYLVFRVQDLGCEVSGFGTHLDPLRFRLR